MRLDENETKLVASDEMELRISQILDKIESFTQTVKLSDELHNAFLICSSSLMIMILVSVGF